MGRGRAGAPRWLACAIHASAVLWLLCRVPVSGSTIDMCYSSDSGNPDECTYGGCMHVSAHGKCTVCSEGLMRTNWLTFRGSQYKLMTGAKAWNDAIDDCRAQGATLASFDSEAEFEWVARHAQNAWIGQFQPTGGGDTCNLHASQMCASPAVCPCAAPYISTFVAYQGSPGYRNCLYVQEHTPLDKYYFGSADCTIAREYVCKRTATFADWLPLTGHGVVVKSFGDLASGSPCAQAICDEEGGFVVSLESATKYAALTTTLGTFPLFLGAGVLPHQTRSGGKPVWLWDSGAGFIPTTHNTPGPWLAASFETGVPVERAVWTGVQVQAQATPAAGTKLVCQRPVSPPAVIAGACSQVVGVAAADLVMHLSFDHGALPTLLTNPDGQWPGVEVHGDTGATVVSGGISGNALQFGTAQHAGLQLPSNGQYGEYPTQHFTVCFFIKFDQSFATGPIFSLNFNEEGPNEAKSGYSFFFNSDRVKFEGHGLKGTSFKTWSKEIKKVDDNLWHHLCMVHEIDRKLYFYVDGVEKQTVSDVDSLSVRGNGYGRGLALVGNDLHNKAADSYGKNFQLDELGIFSVRLNVGQVANARWCGSGTPSPPTPSPPSPPTPAPPTPSPPTPAPPTPAPPTPSPPTPAPPTPSPPTPSPPTPAPPTPSPPTPAPPTPSPPTPAPPTPSPPTPAPPTPSPPTPSPPTPAPPTPSPPTPSPSTPAPSTPSPLTLTPPTPSPPTPAPPTSSPPTPAPLSPAPLTPSPPTPSPPTLSPPTPAPPTPSPPTPAPLSPAPLTPSPPTPSPPTPSPPTPSPPTPAPPTPSPPTPAPLSPAPLTPSPPTPSPPTPSPPTPAPPTPSPPTAAPLSPSPSTSAPSTLTPPTPAPPTPSPPTSAPPTPSPATRAPPTPAPATFSPPTPSPPSLAPPTPSPPTPAPLSPAPLTPSPPTVSPATPSPPTSAPATPFPPTAAPSTSSPPTSSPPTLAPPTPSPPTPSPATPFPPTPAPPTPSPPTPSPPTHAPPTLSPMTPSPPTPAPLSPAPLTLAPPTPSPPTPSPLTPSPPTLTPPTPAPLSPAPLTPSPPTVSPATPSPPTSAPRTTAPATPSPPTASPPTYAPPTAAPSTSSPATPSPPSPAPDTLPPLTPTLAPQTTRPVTEHRSAVPGAPAVVSLAPGWPAGTSSKEVQDGRGVIMLHLQNGEWGDPALLRISTTGEGPADIVLKTSHPQLRHGFHRHAQKGGYIALEVEGPRLAITLAASENYNAAVQEVLAVEINSTALSTSGTYKPAAMSYTITAASRVISEEQVRTTQTVAGATLLGTPMNTGRTSVLLKVIDCPMDLGASEMSWTENPLGLRLDSYDSPDSAGAVLGNLIFMATVLLLHFVIAWVWYAKHIDEREDILSAMARARFPSYSFLPAMMFYQTTIESGVHVARTEPDMAKKLLPVCVLLVYSVGLFAGVYRVLRPSLYSTTFKEADALSSLKGKVLRALNGKGEYSSPGQSWFVWMFGLTFRDYYPRDFRFMLVEIGFSALVGAINGVEVSNKRTCRIQNITIILAYLLYLIILVWRRPYHAVANNVLAIGGALMQTLALVCALVHLSGSDVASLASRAAVWFIYASLAFTIPKSLLDVAGVLYDIPDRSASGHAPASRKHKSKRNPLISDDFTDLEVTVTSNPALAEPLIKSPVSEGLASLATSADGDRGSPNSGFAATAPSPMSHSRGSPNASDYAFSSTRGLLSPQAGFLPTTAPYFRSPSSPRSPMVVPSPRVQSLRRLPGNESSPAISPHRVWARSNTFTGINDAGRASGRGGRGAGHTVGRLVSPEVSP